jgi:hypothetical protein
MASHLMLRGRICRLDLRLGRNERDAALLYERLQFDIGSCNTIFSAWVMFIGALKPAFH